MNTDELQKQHITTLFNKVASSYAQNALFFQEFAEKFVNWVGLQKGQSVLDVATGRGALLPFILSSVGSEGKIIAIDLTENMVALTKQDIYRQKIPNIEVLQMDAENLAFDNNSFDAVLSGFAMHLLPHPDKAFQEIHRVLKPGGIFAFSVGAPTSGERWNFYHDLIAKYDELRDKTQDIASFPDPEKLLEETGFGNISKLNEEVHLSIKDPESFWEMEMSHGRRGFVEALPEDTQKEYKVEVMAGLEKMQESGGIVLDRGAWFYKTIKPQ
jgi:ubiquinone/menaquinone biosynthesis C-methylase UbiE